MSATGRAGSSGDGRARSISGWNAASLRRIAAAALCALAAAGHAQPTQVTVTPASATSLRVTWGLPLPDARLGIGYRGRDYGVRGYMVRYRNRQDAAWTIHPNSGGGTTIRGLTTGDIHLVQARVRGRNAWSDYSEAVAGIPTDTSAGTLAGLTARVTSGSSVSVSWNAVVTPAGVTGYEVRHQGGATLLSSESGWTAKSVAGTSTALTGLTPGHYYAVRVCAKRGTARSPCDWTGVVPNEVPGKPAAPTVETASRTSLRVAWSAPANGGTAVTDYDVRYKRASASAWSTRAFTGTGTSTTITGLSTDVAYDVQVRAENLAGESAWSVSARGTPHGRPGPPAAPTVTVGSGSSLAVAWLAPSHTGDAAVTDYDVRYQASGASSWTSRAFAGTGTSTTVTGLTAGTAYDVQVRAANRFGAGAWSPSGAGTPDEAPGRPAAPTVSAASATSLRVAWAAPTNNGTAIADYDVRYRTGAAAWATHAFAGAGTSTTIAGLTLDTTYEVQVRAGNGFGEGAYSPSGSGAPNEPPGQPAAPTVAPASGSSLDVSWTAPTNRGTAITDYDLRYKRASASGWTSHAFTGTGTSTTITGLTAGTTYHVQARAGNAAGEGDYSPSGSGVPDEPPGRPDAPTVTAASGSSLNVSWNAPANDGTAITDYDLRYKTASASGWTSHDVAGTGTSTTITGLTPGTTYHVQVCAGNAAGMGDYSSSGSGEPNEKPGRPAAPTVTAASGSSLNVSWTAPANNGTAITDYDLQYKRASASIWTSHAFSGVGTSTTITGLTAGVTYHVQVRAGNAAGEGDYSPSGSGVPNEPPGRPAAPMVTVACDSGSSLKISWTAPANNGTAITDYDVRYKRASVSVWSSHAFAGTGTSTTLTGLTAGTSYHVQVRAGNIAGEGEYSPSGSRAPDEKPGRPAAPTVTAASGSSLRVSWTAPANRGTAITDYDVRYKTASASRWTNHAFSGTGTSTTLTGLTTGTTYHVQVRAGKAACEGAYSPSGSGRPDEKPGRPAAPTVTASGSGLSVSWTAPANNGTAITDYDVRYKTASASRWSNHAFSGTGTSTTITGLTAGTTYHVQVRAGNAAGVGPYSPSRSARVGGPPGRPAAPTVTAASATSLTVSWRAPADGGSAITDYDVRYKRASASSWTNHPFTGAGTSTTITGLTAGVTYEVEVRAQNTHGESGYSPSGSGTPNRVPGRPRAPTVTVASGSSLNVSWSAPTNTGSAITDYDVRYRPVGRSWTDRTFTGTGRSTTITGLTAGVTYQVQVRASNGAAGAWSPSTSATPNVKPGRPAAPAVTVASGSSLTISWTAPANGGTAITDYDLQYKAGTDSGWSSHAFSGTGTSTTITGLTAGAAYRVQVRAGNAAGEGRYSPSGTGTPNEVPGQVAAPTVAPAGTSKLGVHWTAPANGGTAITGYDVRHKLATAPSTAWSVPKAVTGTSTTIEELTKDATYEVKVRAKNAHGPGEYSDIGSGAPADVPEFTAEYDFGSHAIVLRFTEDLGDLSTAFYEIEETFQSGTPAKARGGVEYRRRNPEQGAWAFRARKCTQRSPVEETIFDCGAWSAKAFVTVSGTGPFGPEPTLVTSTVPGNLPHDLGVTKGGDAYVNIPILPAPGVAGLEPRLSIDYGGGRQRQLLDRHDPADTLGYGWRISGLSAIHRCVKNTSAGSIALGSGDALCLDGEPLVLIAGTHLTAGAEYRTYRESFVKVLAKSRAGALWFEALLPNGGRREYGNTADSRLHAKLASRSGDLIWSLNREEDAFDSPNNGPDNDMTITYHEDERALVRQPSEISYGNNGDAKLRFLYTARADPETVTQGGVARTRHLLLHTVRAVLDGKTVREYRLLSETTGDGWRRLNEAQLCGYDKTGANPQCLAALDVDWMDTSIAADGYKTCVSGVTDPLGRTTTFSYGTIRSTGTHPFLFTERPFGEVGALSDVVAQAAARDGTIKPVVTAVVRGNGVGGTNRTSYAYQGGPYRGKKNWGLVGFAATRVTDGTNDTVTYLQHRLDALHFAELAAEHVYDGAYGGASVKALSKRWVERSARDVNHTVNTVGDDGATTRTTTATKLVHASAETVVHHEGGTALGATRTAWKHYYADTGAGSLASPAGSTLTTSLATSTLETTTAGTGMEVPKATGWDEVPSWTFTRKLRERKATFDLRNRVSASRWLVGFVCQATEAHHRGAAAAERTLWTAYTPHEDTMAPAAERRFGAKDANCVGEANGASPTGLNLTTARVYDTYGNPASETVSGGNVESRTTTASAFADARYPGAVANDLDHSETFAYDPRFGVPDSVADANGRTTSRKLDPFGRVVELTNADGVKFTTAYSRCGPGVVCAAVDGVAPAMKVEVESSPKVAPKVTRYLDKLGRVVRVRTESFDGANDILEDVRHDARGRVLQRSAPYFANAMAADVPKTSYLYDDLDRVTSETRPDGGVTTYAYAAGTDGATTVTATEKVYADTTLSATIATVATYNLLGEVASVTEASGTTDAATTTYTYDASGLPATVAVGGTNVATFEHDAAGNRTSATDPNTGKTTFTHTALGQTRTVCDALGQPSTGSACLARGLTTYEYDVLGRVTSRSDADGKAFWTYDPTNGKGLLHQRCRGSATLTGCGGTPDFAETLAYGADARPSAATTVIRADGQAARAYARAFTYDSGRLLTEAHPSGVPADPHGVTTLREYNARGYLAAVKDNATKAVLERYTATDAFGSVTAVAHGNGAKTARTFDANTGRQTGVETTRGTGAAKTVAQDFDYAWRSDGTLSSRAKASATPKLTETLTRDPLRRLTRAKVGTDGRSLTYGHDALGNLLNRTSTAGADKNVELCGHNTGPASARGPHAPRFALVGDERRALAYDAAGRMTSRTACAGAATECTTGACAAKANADNRYVTWNAQGEATRVLLGSSSTDATPTAREDFARGPDGRLHFRKSTWRESGAERVERRYMVGRFEEVVPAYASSTNEWVRKTLLTDTVLHVQVKPRGGAATSRYEYLHRDHLGSVTAVTDAAGAAARQTTHDPYGVRRVSDWTRAETPAETAAWADDDTRSTRGFGGHGQLDRASLVDTGGRLYDPELGIFLSPDPLVPDPFSSQGWNPYSYVGNRPLSRVDPTGFMFAPAGCNIGGVLCPGGGSGGGAGGTGGGFSTRAVWAVEAVFGVRWGLVVNLLFDPDLGFDVHYDWRPQPYFSLTARQVNIPNDDGEPGDKPLFRRRSPSRWDRYLAARAHITVVRSFENRGHRYTIRGRICRGGTEGCDSRLARTVYDGVNDNDVPFTFDDQTEGTRRLLLLFPIDHEADPTNLVTTNTTEPGHPFHPDDGVPATAKHRVFWDEHTGDLYYEVVGEGTGPMGRFNNLLGVQLFLPGVYEAVMRHNPEVRKVPVR